MFQRARSGDRSVFGHVPDQQYRNLKRLRDVNQRARHFAHLRGASGDAIHVLGDYCLRGIDDHQCRFGLFDQRERGAQVGGGGEQQIRLDGADARRPHTHLRLRFLSRDIQHGVAFHSCRRQTSDVSRGFQQQRRFADAGLSGYKRHRSRYDAAAENAVEFVESRADSCDAFRPYVGDRRCGGGSDRIRARP